MSTKNKVAAFTLLECLIALMVLSGSLLVYQAMSQLLHQDLHQQETNPQKDWLVFSEQLRGELENARLIKLDANRLYIEKDGQKLAFGQAKAGDFRKTNDKGQGFQPMLYGVKESQLSLNGNQLHLHITFDNGLERSFLYAFPSENR